MLFRATGSLDFGAWRGSAGTLAVLTKQFSLALLFIGFGTKAGIIPFHVWLPEAHPAAPTPVSALMSGVMIKTGIYMIIRMFFDIIPGANIWLGGGIMALGMATCLLGILFALSEKDIKRMLAYSSVENVGIIVLALGASLSFISFGMTPLALVALTAALVHTV